MSDQVDESVLQLTAKIVSAHIGNNQVTTDALPSLIQAVYHSLVNAGTVVAPTEAPTPAVPAKKSVFADYIVCLEDGKKLKMLKRHLKTSYNMTPAEYRTKWGLPNDYPMVAPSYASRRSALAKQTGLGRKPAVVVEPEVAKLPARKAKGARG